MFATTTRRPVNLRQIATATALAAGAVLASATLAGCVGEAEAASRSTSSVPLRAPSDEIRGEERAVLTAAPDVPPPTCRRRSPAPTRRR
jgi:hypothetical protein